MPENQEINAPIESNKEISVDKTSPTPDSFSSIQNNPLFQAQINTYKTDQPQIEKNIMEYLQKNNQKAESINKVLNNPNIDEAKKAKIINAIIDASMKEAEVFTETTPEKQTTIKQEINSIPVQVDIKKTQETKQETITKKIELTDRTEQINKHIQEVESARQTLITQNPKLDIKPESPQYLEVSQKLEASGIIKTLTDKRLTAENISKFVSFKATQEAIKADPSIQNTESFLLSFKKLENELNLPDSSREDFSSKNIEHTSQEIFNPEIGNQNLIDTVSEQKKAHAGDFEKLFDEPKDIGALNDVYGKFLPESQKTYKIIQDKQQNNIQISQDDEAFLNRFKAELETQKAAFEAKTTESMEQSTILGPIMGLANYMDMGIGNTFEFNKSNDIQIDNGMLSITGNIDNKPFTLETNLDKPSKLKTSDYLNKTDDSNMGVANQNRQETAYIMPGHKEIRENIKENFGKTHQDILKNASSLEEYQETLKKTLCENVQKLYGLKDLVQTRIEKQITKNIAAQETLDMLNTTVLDGKYDYDKNINKNLNPELHNFLSDLDYSLENLSSDEIDSRRQNIQELGKVLNNNQLGKQKNSCKILQDLSPSLLNQTKNIMERKPSTEGQKNTSLFTFFECLKDPQSKTYRVEEFHNLLEENKKIEPNEKTYKKTTEDRNKKTADDELDLSLFISVEETTTIEYNYT